MKSLHRWVVAAAILGGFFIACSPAVAQWQAPDHSIPVGRGVGATGFKNAAPGAAGGVLTSNGPSSDPTFKPPVGAVPVTFCGADLTGVSDSQSAFNTCLSTYGSVSIPTGTYLIGCSGGNGISVANGKTLVGVTQGNVTLNYNCTSGNAINLTGDTAITLGNFTVNRTSGTPVSGAGIGATGALQCQSSNFFNITVLNQWNGFAWLPANFCTITNVNAWNNYNDGHVFATTTTSGLMQYQIQGITSETNNGWGFTITTAAQTSGGGTFLTWQQVDTFANGAGGFRIIASVAHPVFDLRLLNINFSNDNGDCINFNSFGQNNEISAGFIEGCGGWVSGNGRNFAIAKSSVGNSIVLKNNYNIIVSGIHINGTSNNGITTDGTNNNPVISNNTLINIGSATANTYDGIQIASGSELALITGNSVLNTTTRYGINSASSGAVISQNQVAGQTAGCNITNGGVGTGNKGTSCVDILGNKAQILGTATNDSAPAGYVGEHVSATAAGGSVSLTSGTTANVTSISLTAGDWDVSAFCQFTPASTTVVSFGICGSSTTSATRDATLGKESFIQNGTSGTNSNAPTATSPPIRYSLASTTTIYLVATSNFTTSTNTVGGFIRARRIR